MNPRPDALFRAFATQEERRAFGGSAFVELQYCRLPSGTLVERIMDVRSLSHWRSDSLYVHDEDLELFDREYGRLFGCGTVDLFGVNYCAPSSLDATQDAIRASRPPDFETLLRWLDDAKAYNGFYILGI